MLASPVLGPREKAVCAVPGAAHDGSPPSAGGVSSIMGQIESQFNSPPQSLRRLMVFGGKVFKEVHVLK